MQRKLIEWLKQQPKEFVNEIVNNEILGDGNFTIESLAELDEKYSPEDENDR